MNEVSPLNRNEIQDQRKYSLCTRQTESPMKNPGPVGHPSKISDTALLLSASFGKYTPFSYGRYEVTDALERFSSRIVAARASV